MKIKEEIINVLKALAPQIDKSKAKLELDTSAVSISRLLMESKGLELIEYICENLEYGELPIYSMNKFLEKPEFDKLIEQFYINEKQRILDVLLLLYHQIWVNKQGEESRQIFETLKKLEESKAISSKEKILRICLDCYSTYSEEHANCDECGSTNILEISELILSEPAKSVLQNGQYLEIYVRECMHKSGIEPVGWNIDESNKKVYTSIKYQVEGEEIEIDVLGISQPIAVLICEAKTSKKITLNEIRRVEDLFNKLSRKIGDLIGRKLQYFKLFIITGEFDRNIPTRAYRRERWELIHKHKISNLTEEFKRIKSEI
ncbi:MAG: hypothetical protein Q6352_000140 [Candidatus Freyrarchaeum guaymaensis]